MQKSGSTFFHHLLAQHPEICLGRMSEIHFYTINFEKGFGWYTSQFEHCNNKILFDISPKYFMTGEEAAPRLKQYVSNPKFSIILRNPVDYVFSHYRMHYNQGFFLKYHCQKFKRNPSFDELLERFPEYLERGKYYQLFSKWLLYFDLSKFKILIFEEFIKNTKLFMNEIFDFFQINRIELKDVRETSKNKALRNPSFYKIKRFLIKREKIKNKLKNSQILNKIYDSFLTKSSKIPENHKIKLQEYYKDDIKKLSQLLGIDLQNWFL